MFRLIRKALAAAALAMPFLASAAIEVDQLGAKTTTEAASYLTGQKFDIEARQVGLAAPIFPADFAVSSGSYDWTVGALVNGQEVRRMDMTFKADTTDNLSLALNANFTFGWRTERWMTTAPQASLYSGLTEHIQVTTLDGFLISEQQRSYDLSSDAAWTASNAFDLTGLPNQFRLVHTFALTPNGSADVSGLLSQHAVFSYSWGASGFFTMPSAVPEPSTYALMLAGLLIVGLSKKRMV